MLNGPDVYGATTYLTLDRSVPVVMTPGQRVLHLRTEVEVAVLAFAPASIGRSFRPA